MSADKKPSPPEIAALLAKVIDQKIQLSKVQGEIDHLQAMIDRLQKTPPFRPEEPD